MGLVRQPRAARVVSFLIAVCCAIFPAQAQYSGGSGTAVDPYRIATVADLVHLASSESDWDKHFVLNADINLSGRTWSGPLIREFHGTLDGQGHQIGNMVVHGSHHLGLVGTLKPDAEVRDLSVAAASVVGTSNHVGILVGDNRGTISNSYTAGTVRGNGAVGGLVGGNGGRVVDCHSNASVMGQAHTGGLVGVNRDSGNLRRTYCTGRVWGNDRTGGLAGANHGVIRSSYSTSEVSGSVYVGGLVGNNYEAIVFGSYSAGAIGGHVAVGGLVGGNREGASIISSYSTGPVDGGSGTGGLVGDNLASHVVNSYSTGIVEGSSNVGGLVGKNIDGGIVVNSYWDKTASGQGRSAGGIGLTAAQMTDGVTYLESGWDFVGEAANGLHETWQMAVQDSPPVLSIFNGYQPPTLAGAGTAGSPYSISSGRELGAIVHYRLDAHYEMVASFDMSGVTWATSVIPEFSGVFDGNNRSIGNLRITDSRYGAPNPAGISHIPTTQGYLGFIGTLKASGQVRYLSILNADVVGSGENVGSVAGSNEGLLTDVFSSGTVEGRDCVGGLVGILCERASVLHSASASTVQGDWAVGGLVGLSLHTRCAVLRCNNSGAINGDRDVGGLVGFNQGSIIHSHNTGTVSADQHAGGLTGSNAGSVSHSYSSGAISGRIWAGGLVGHNQSLAGIFWSYSAGAISGSEATAGLVGINTGSVGACYSTGEVVGRENAGGLIGSNSGSVTVSYSTGHVAGQEHVGGLVGLADGGAVRSSFWALESSGRSSSDGGVGLDAVQMRDPEVYLGAGWDFVGEVANGLHESWQMPPQAGPPVLAIFHGYQPPILAGEGTPDSPHLISNGSELAAMAHHRADRYYELSQGIDLSGVSWPMPVIPQLSGGLDGKGFPIHGLTVTGAGDLGLVGTLRSGAELRGLCVIDANISGSGDHVGALVGYSRGTITHAFCSATVAGAKYVGGLVGRVRHGNVTHSCCVVTASGGDHVGGLVGYNLEGNVTYSYSSGAVSGERNVGGLVGYNHRLSSNRAVSNCYSHATVTGNRAVGGLVGHNKNMTIASIYATGPVAGSDEVGGLVGWSTAGDGAAQKGCFWDAERSGQNESAGGKGVITEQMQTAATFLEAGWDFVDETENGTDDIWWIDEHQDYPRLWWEWIENEGG